MLSPQIHASAGGGWGEIPTLFLDILLDPQMNFFTGQLETHEEVGGGGDMRAGEWNSEASQRFCKDE